MRQLFKRILSTEYNFGCLILIAIVELRLLQTSIAREKVSKVTKSLIYSSLEMQFLIKIQVS